MPVPTLAALTGIAAAVGGGRPTLEPQPARRIRAEVTGVTPTSDVERSGNSGRPQDAGEVARTFPSRRQWGLCNQASTTHYSLFAVGREPGAHILAGAAARRLAGRYRAERRADTRSFATGLHNDLAAVTAGLTPLQLRRSKAHSQPHQDDQAGDVRPSQIRPATEANPQPSDQHVRPPLIKVCGRRRPLTSCLVGQRHVRRRHAGRSHLVSRLVPQAIRRFKLIFAIAIPSTSRANHGCNTSGM
jgi:hypothetical protein